MTDPKGALEEGLRQLYPQLLAFACFLTQDRPNAEDIVQDSIVRVLSRRRTTPVDNLGAYLRQVVTHEFLRSARKRSPRGRPDAPSGFEPDGTSFDEFLALLIELSPRERVVIGCRFYLDLDVRTTADAMGCRSSTIRTLQARAIKKLRAQLSDSEAPAVGRSGPLGAESMWR